MTTAVSHQASCVAVQGRAILIEGDPGIGKTTLAHMLIDRGAILVGDDGVQLVVRDDILWAMPHPNTRGLMEIRNVGIVSRRVAEAPVALVIQLTHDAPRYVEAAAMVPRAGRSVPLLQLWPETPALALRAEAALTLHGLPLP